MDSIDDNYQLSATSGYLNIDIHKLTNKQQGKHVMYINNPKNTQEIANEVLNFFILFSDLAKQNGHRKHHLTAGHLAIMMAIPESFENGQHLISTFSCMRVFKSFRALNYPGSYASFRKNLNELVRLGFLKKENYEYSYNIHFSKQQIDNNVNLN